MRACASVCDGTSLIGRRLVACRMESGDVEDFGARLGSEMIGILIALGDATLILLTVRE